MCMCIINIAATRRQAPEEILCSQLCLFNMSLLRKGDYRTLILQNDGLRLGKERMGEGYIPLLILVPWLCLALQRPAFSLWLPRAAMVSPQPHPFLLT